MLVSVLEKITHVAPIILRAPHHKPWILNLSTAQPWFLAWASFHEGRNQTGTLSSEEVWIAAVCIWAMSKNFHEDNCVVWVYTCISPLFCFKHQWESHGNFPLFWEDIHPSCYIYIWMVHLSQLWSSNDPSCALEWQVHSGIHNLPLRRIQLLFYFCISKFLTRMSRGAQCRLWLSHCCQIWQVTSMLTAYLTCTQP